MSKKLLQPLEKLLNGVTVGMLATATSTFLVYNYYQEKFDLSVDVRDHSTTFRALDFIDQKSLDFRFKQRGPRDSTEKVAVLAIDDASLNQIGRWPWSREVIATMIDNLMNQGAKALGFDMVFSEPQIDKARQIIEQIESNRNLSPELTAAFDHIKGQLQPDSRFAEVIKKHRDRLIMGAFYDGMSRNLKPYQDLCYSEAFKRSQGYVIRNTEEWPPFVFNEFYNKEVKGVKNTFVFENTPFEKVFTPIFERLEAEEKQRFVTEVLKKNPDAPLSWIEQSQLIAAQENALRDYCITWLETNGGKTGGDRFFEEWKNGWPELMADNKLLANSNLLSELHNFKNYFFRNPIEQTGRWTVDIPELTSSAAHFGMFSAILDTDGTIRRSSLFYRTGLRQEDMVPSLALQTFLVASGLQAYLTFDEDRSDLFGRLNTHQFAVKKLEIRDPETDQVRFVVPVDHRGRLLINYAGPQMSFPYLPASELFHDRPTIKIVQSVFDPHLNKNVLKTSYVNRDEFIKDRLFIVGATAMAVYDLRVTPFEENYPGVETHVNVLANLVSQNFLRTHPQEFKFMIFSLLGIGLLASLLLHYLGAFTSLLATGAIVGGIMAVDRYWLFGRGIVVASAFPILEVFFVYVSVTFFKYFWEERKKKYLKATFSKYVSPAIVDEILKDPENVQLGGRKQRMSVFFSDVRNFTTISEKLDPQMLSSVLNEYLTPMTYIVFNNKGTLDKYMGDAVMAFFGAPLFFEDHAKHACRCAIQSIEKLKEIQTNFANRGYPMIDIGIGVNTYDMSVGNMGSDIVRSYTVMGDGVNLGSRLEGLNKEYGSRILISEFTYQDVSQDFACRELDWVRVKGKHQPIKIYELICEGAPSPAQATMIKLFEEGYRLYREARFEDAVTAFKKALQATPDDPVAATYLERCEELSANPPPTPWDGVFTMKTK